MELGGPQRAMATLEPGPASRATVPHPGESVRPPPAAADLEARRRARHRRRLGFEQICTIMFAFEYEFNVFYNYTNFICP